MCSLGGLSPAWGGRGWVDGGGGWANRLGLLGDDRLASGAQGDCKISMFYDFEFCFSVQKHETNDFKSVIVPGYKPLQFGPNLQFSRSLEWRADRSCVLVR